MGILRSVRSVLPIPKDWERDSDRKNFAIRVETALRELFSRRVAKIKVNGSEVQTDDHDVADLGRFADTIYLTSSDTTWANVYAKISKLTIPYPATIYVNSSAITALTNGEITSGAWVGIISKTNSVQGNYSLILKSAGNQIRACAITGATSASANITFTSLRKADNDEVVHLTGDETIDGLKAFIGTHRIGNSATNPSIGFAGSNNDNTSGIIYCRGAGTGNTQGYGQAMFSFIEYSPASDGSSRNNYERYDLPAVDVARSGSETYKIYTEKNLVSEAAASGGTTKSLVTTGEKHTWNSKVSCTEQNAKNAVGCSLVSTDSNWVFTKAGLFVRPIRVITASGTTASSGNLNIDSKIPTGYRPISANLTANPSGVSGLVLVHVAYSNSGTWYIAVRKSDGSVVASTAVDFEITCISTLFAN